MSCTSLIPHQPLTFSSGSKLRMQLHRQTHNFQTGQDTLNLSYMITVSPKCSSKIHPLAYRLYTISITENLYSHYQSTTTNNTVSTTLHKLCSGTVFTCVKCQSHTHMDNPTWGCYWWGFVCTQVWPLTLHGNDLWSCQQKRERGSLFCLCSITVKLRFLNISDFVAAGRV